MILFNLRFLIPDTMDTNKVNNKITAIIIMVILLLCKTPTAHSGESKSYTDEFLFISTYFDCLSDFVEVNNISLLLNIGIHKYDKDHYYTEQEILDSDFMRKLKYEQAFVSKMLRNMKAYKNSDNLQIKKAANKIVNIYEQKKDINIRAQESFYYTKLRKFKAGIAEGNELADEHSSSVYFGATFDISYLIRDVIVPPDSMELKITYNEKAHLKQQIEGFKEIENNQRLGWAHIDPILTIEHGWLPNINP